MRFVGRAAELRHVTEVVASAEALWITGPTGIGKSRLAREAIGDRAAIQLDGRAMATRGEALPYLAEVLGVAAPGAERAEAIAAWLGAALAGLAGRTEVLIVDDLHLAERSLAGSLLRIVRRIPLGYPVVAIGRDQWTTSELVGDRLHHLPLHELSDADTELFARAYGRGADELPRAAAGHPLLMDLFLRDGSAAIDDWTESLLGELAPHGALLARLVVAGSPAQLRWALDGRDETELELLRAGGVFERGRGVLRPVAHGIARRIEETGQRDELERELLAYLACRPALAAVDLARAIQLAIHHEAADRLAELLARHAAGSAVVQHALVGALCDHRVSAKAKLNSFHALAEHITLGSVDDLLHVYDRLIDSVDTVERRVAQISLLRAALVSGHRRWPREASACFDEILACPAVPAIAKQQILHLWAVRAIHARRRPAELAEVLALLAQHGLDAPALHAYRVLFDGVELTYQYRLDEAIDRLRESAAAFEACGRPLHVAWIQRYLLALCYSGSRAAEFRALLSQIGASSRDQLRGDHRYRFFQTIDDWNGGDSETLERACASAPAVPAPRRHSLLPGPYLADCHAACLHAIRDRARGAAIAPAVVELFAAALDRMMVTAPIVLASVCLAQHAWLAGDRAAVARLRAALRPLGPIGAIHAQLLGAFEEAAGEGADPAHVLALVERAVIVREPLATPYYVVMAARLIAGHGMPAVDFAARIREHPQLADLPLRARWVIEAAVRALGAAPGTGAAPPDEVARAVAAQIHTAGATAARAARPGDGSVQALKRLIDDQWFDGVRLGTFARENNLSRFAISRRFKTATGKSPRQYLQETRINQAKQLLVEANWTVADIAFECGFTDAAQFSRMFKQATGMTPMRYRTSSRGASPKP
jgi:AraC-like DNA-binding protein